MCKPKRKRLLLADNDPDYRHSLRGLLELKNYHVEEADSVDEARERLETVPLDLVLIDLRLTDDGDEHDLSGLEVAKKAIDKGIPRIIITSFPSRETTRVALASRGLEPLAQDYVPKEEGPQAVLDTIDIVLRRRGREPTEASTELMVDLELGLAWYKGETLRLSRYQYALLAYLYEKKGAVCSPEELLKAIYDEDVPPTQASADKRLERLVDRLRKKVEEDPSQPRHLVKVLGRGYRLAIDP